MIIDEAHKFSDALNQMQTFELNLPSTTCILEKLKSSDKETMKRIDMAIFQLSYISKHLSDFPNNEVVTFESKVRHFLKQLFGVIHDLNKAYANSDLFDVEQALAHIVSHEPRIFWLADETIHSVSKIPGQLIKNVLYDKTLPVILTSGTLSIGGDFNYFKRELGLHSVSAFKLKTTSERSPYNLKEQCQVYISERTLTPDPENPEYFKSIAKEIVVLINLTKGRTLILFHILQGDATGI